MWPEQVVVEHGGFQKINCSTSCLKPESSGLETSLDKILLDEQVRWKRFLISNISKDVVVLCYFTCSGKQVSSTVNVSVFRECYTQDPSPRVEPASNEWMQSYCYCSGALLSRPPPPRAAGVTRSRA